MMEKVNNIPKLRYVEIKETDKQISEFCKELNISAPFFRNGRKISK